MNDSNVISLKPSFLKEVFVAPDLVLGDDKWLLALLEKAERVTRREITGKHSERQWTRRRENPTAQEALDEERRLKLLPENIRQCLFQAYRLPPRNRDEDALPLQVLNERDRAHAAAQTRMRELLQERNYPAFVLKW
jgi:hypothetical protein